MLIRKLHTAETGLYAAHLKRLTPYDRSSRFSEASVGDELIDKYVARRLRIWLIRRQGRRGTGYRQYPDQFLYETLGLIRLLPGRAAMPNAKV